MSEDQALVPFGKEERIVGVTDNISPEELLRQIQVIQTVMTKAMKENEHYGKIPGCGPKPVLLKPGAEKLCFTFRMDPEFDVNIVDLGKDHREYRVKCTLFAINGGNRLGSGVGCATTKETKWRYRKEGNERVENPNIADIYNTALKIAKKRAMVDAVLTCTAASDIFTQDLEDMEFHQPASGSTPPSAKAGKEEERPKKSSPPAPKSDEEFDRDAYLGHLSTLLNTLVDDAGFNDTGEALLALTKTEKFRGFKDIFKLKHDWQFKNAIEKAESLLKKDDGDFLGEDVPY